MIAKVLIRHKSYGDKVLFDGLEFALQDNEKVGIIGVNGCGKSTLLKVLLEKDTDYDGEITTKKGISISSTSQEHTESADSSVLTYITSGLPEYAELSHLITFLPETMGNNPRKIQQYSDALERFGTLGYYDIESSLLEIIHFYQLPNDVLERKFSSLSGGQKRLIELVKVQQANSHLNLIDEPTNHMDYIAKQRFIDWMKQSKNCIVVVTHDRDVLLAVDRIVEIRDGKAYSYSGNYDAYLKNHTVRISSEVNEHEIIKRRIENLKENIVRFRRLKERSRDPGTIKRFKALELKAKDELEELQDKDKPTFWIDKESASNLPTKISDAYQEHKARTIKIRSAKKDSNHRKLLQVQDLSLGYAEPLFEHVSLEIYEGDRLQIKGRNGRGKTTLLKTIIAQANNLKLPCTVFKGTIEADSSLNIGIYEQELSQERISSSLSDAIEAILRVHDKEISDRRIRQIMSDYLFNPITDFDTPVALLSGGQKARLQLIDMMATDPNLLILDEPTNHLDLPSIEELEEMLRSYHGAVLYVSHDSYFSRNIAASQLELI